MRQIIEEVCQAENGRAAAQGDGAARRDQGAGLLRDAPFLGDVFVQLALEGLVRDAVDGHHAAVGADDEAVLLHDRQLLAQGGQGDVEDLAELLDRQLPAAFEQGDDLLFTLQGFHGNPPGKEWTYFIPKRAICTEKSLPNPCIYAEKCGGFLHVCPGSLNKRRESADNTQTRLTVETRRSVRRGGRRICARFARRAA